MRIEPGQLNFFGNQLFLRFANVVAVVVPTVPGLEYTLDANLQHNTIENNKMHSTIDSNLMHFTLDDEDS